MYLVNEKNMFKNIVWKSANYSLKICEFFGESVSWFENVVKWGAGVAENNVVKMFLFSSRIGAPDGQQKVYINAWQQFFSETTWSIRRDCTSARILPKLMRGFSKLFQLPHQEEERLNQHHLTDATKWQMANINRQWKLESYSRSFITSLIIM